MHQVPETFTAVHVSMPSFFTFSFTVNFLLSSVSDTQVELFFPTYTGFTAGLPVILSTSLNALLMPWVGANSGLGPDAFFFWLRCR